MPTGNPDVLDRDAFRAALVANDIPALKALIQAADTALHVLFDGGADIVSLVHDRAAMVDRVLITAWHHHLGDDFPLVLAAVGGYGRGELHPASDVDLLILVGEGDDEAFAEPLSDFLTLLWDIGLEIGHSVRTLAECEEEARNDLTIITNLTELRRLAGPANLAGELQRRIAAGRMWDDRDFFEAKLDEQRQRHHRFEDTAYNLEPNLKSSPGGLRDIQMIGWVVKRHFGTDTLGELIRHGFLTQSECADLMAGQAHLWRIRWALHRLTGRHDDRLLFDHQRTLARQLGYEEATGGNEGNLAVEAFMQSYYRTVMTLNRLNEMLLQLFREELLLAHDDNTPTPINKRFQLRKGYIETTHPDVFRRYPFALLEIFLVIQHQPKAKGVRASTIRSIRENLHRIDKDFRADLRCRALFMEIFRQPRGLTRALRRMNRYGVLAAYLPAFGNIVGRMQYDLFHAYTVDQHTLFLIRNLRRFALRLHADEFPLASRIHKQIPKPDLLYLAGLFHDIAKGRGGDHSELGEQDAIQFGRTHGLSRYDTALVAWLVRHHLMMSATAQRKDISDPEVIHDFAEAVGDQTHLDYLYLLTVADIRATNPKQWNSWKASLLADLYDATSRALRRGLTNPVNKDIRIRETREEALARLDASPLDKQQIERAWSQLDEDYFLQHTGEEIAWHTEAVADLPENLLPVVLVRRTGTANEASGNGSMTTLFVHAQDNPGLFARITAAIATLGLNTVDARILSDGRGLTYNSFALLEQDGGDIDNPDRLEDIRIAVHDAITSREIPVAPHPRVPRQLKAFDIPTRITYSDRLHQGRTVLELICRDRPGLLAHIAHGLHRCGVEVFKAKIATIGERAEDVFFLTDTDGRPVDEPATRQALELALLQELSRPS
ncbi:MAG: [protein-PII] uridylyltransferase [Chromatiales bacterium]|nr:[protein-PII] uridylyltransferase [Gammaproteobacteria bacterium]MCP5352845.1 [protein-PII] uridylyltransferase [Chromatiales bacterium]